MKIQYTVLLAAALAAAVSAQAADKAKLGRREPRKRSEGRCRNADASSRPN